MRIYGLKACDTCRKAVKALNGAVFVDVRAEPLERAQIARFLDAFAAALVNTRSTTWRGLSQDERAEAHADLLVRYPALMKRPVIEDDAGVLHLGWSKDVQAALGV
ncbi:arsenate reductase family protein [Gymnodinialimonas ulvae]|uniref:arsenate reductase family protein n=1 Tax=Gymnodinialimonas ulvae TaxID=3126504 RepID=UPI0030A1EC06